MVGLVVLLSITALILAGLKSCTCLGHVCTLHTEQWRNDAFYFPSPKCDIVRHFLVFPSPLRVLLQFSISSQKSFLAGGDPALVDGNKLREGNCLGEKWLTMTTEQQCGHYYGISLNVRQTVKKMFFVGGKLCVDAPARLGMIHVSR